MVSNAFDISLHKDIGNITGNKDWRETIGDNETKHNDTTKDTTNKYPCPYSYYYY